MGASGWSCVVPWRGDLEEALREARAHAYASLPRAEREPVEAMGIEPLLRALDLDLEDEDEELIEEFRTWLEEAGPETRFVVSRGPNATGTVLDADHIKKRVASKARPDPSAQPGSGVVLHLAQPSPGLLGVRVPSDEELMARLETTRPTLELAMTWLDSMDRDEVVAILLDGEAQIAFLGVTGD